MSGERATATASAVVVKSLSSSAVEATYYGRVNAAVIEQALRETLAIHRSAPVRWQLIDASRIESVDPAMRAAATSAMSQLKEREISTIVVVSLGAARMLGSAVAFAAGFPLRFAATREEAIGMLRAEKAL